MVDMASAVKESMSLSLILQMYEPMAQLANPMANNSQPKLTQNIADAKNGPCCYACIPHISIKCSNSQTLLFFLKAMQTLRLKP
jgi:hypothetical protein